MNPQSAVIIFLAVIYIASTIGIVFASRKYAAAYQVENQCTPEAARKAALKITVPIWIFNTLAILGFIYLFR